MKQLASLCLLLALAACGGGGDKTQTALYCPDVRVLAQANSLTQYQPGQHGVAAEISQASITGVNGSCVLLPKRGVVRVTFQAGFSATNGPADHGAGVTLPYFVSQSEGDTIIAKTQYSITVPFDGNVSTASATSKPITLELPNTPDTAQTDILVAFQLGQDQVAGTAAPY